MCLRTRYYTNSCVHCYGYIISCPSCGKQLFKVAGNCSVEITCVRCKKEIVGVVDEIYMKIFENCRGKEHDQEKASRYSTDMEALRQRKRAM